MNGDDIYGYYSTLPWLDEEARVTLGTVCRKIHECATLLSSIKMRSHHSCAASIGSWGLKKQLDVLNRSGSSVEWTVWATLDSTIGNLPQLFDSLRLYAVEDARAERDVAEFGRFLPMPDPEPLLRHGQTTEEWDAYWEWLIDELQNADSLLREFHGQVDVLRPILWRCLALSKFLSVATAVVRYAHDLTGVKIASDRIPDEGE